MHGIEILLLNLSDFQVRESGSDNRSLIKLHLDGVLKFLMENNIQKLCFYC